MLDAARVACDHAHVFGSEAKLVGRDLGKSGLEALALGGRAGEHHDASPCVHPHARGLEGPDARQLDVAGEAHSHQTALGAGGRRLRAPRLVAGALERPTEHGREIAAVENHVAARAIVRQPDVPRHVLGSHEVGQPHLRPLAACLSGHEVKDPLDHEHRLRLSGAAIWRHGHPVGVAALEARQDGGDPVGPGEHGRGEERDHEPARRVGAGIVDEPVAEGENSPAVVEAHRHLVLLLSLLRRGQHVLEPVLEPADGTAETPCEKRDQHIFRIDDELGPEAATHVRRDDAHLVGREVEKIGDELADLVRHLRRGPHRELAEGGIPVRDEPACLHGLAAAPPDAERELDHPRRGTERGFDVAAREGDAPR